MLRPTLILVLAASTLPLSACTTEQLHGTAQGYERNQCSKIADKVEFDRCMARANTAFESYKRESGAERK